MIQSELVDRICSDIRDVKNTNDLRVISNAIKQTRKWLAAEIGNKLQVGDNVRISGSNKIERGEIIKINRTRAVVRIDNQQWTVPFSMITKETK